MISSLYVLPSANPEDGPDLASALGWYHFTNFVFARAQAFPEAAHFCAFGSNQLDALEHDLEHLPHAAGIDPDLTAIAGQVLAALKARPEGTEEFRATTGEAAEGETSESIFREDHGPPPFKGAVFNDATHRWEKPDEQGGAGKSGTAPELSDADRTAITDGIDRDVAALPEEQQKEAAGLVAKAKDLALTAAAKALQWLHQFNESQIGKLVMEGVDAIFDGPSDMRKLGYNPNITSGTANPKNADAVASNLQDALGFGVSGHLVASIASKVLTKVVYWAKAKLAGGKSESVEGADGVEMWADLIAQLLGHLAEEFGTGGSPDKDMVVKNLRALLGAKS